MWPFRTKNVVASDAGDLDELRKRVQRLEIGLVESADMLNKCYDQLVKAARRENGATGGRPATKRGGLDAGIIPGRPFNHN